MARSPSMASCSACLRAASLRTRSSSASRSMRTLSMAASRNTSTALAISPISSLLPSAGTSTLRSPAASVGHRVGHALDGVGDGAADQPGEQRAESEAADAEHQAEPLDVRDQHVRLVLDRSFLGNQCRLNELGVGADLARQIAHLAMEQRGDLVGVVRRLPVGGVVGGNVGVDLVEQPAHVVVDDGAAEGCHRHLEIGERLVRRGGGRRIVADEVLVDVEPGQQQLLQGLAGQNHGVGVAGLADRPALQLLDLVAQLGADGIEDVPLQLVLLAAQHDNLVEVLGVGLELLGQVHHLACGARGS